MSVADKRRLHAIHYPEKTMTEELQLRPSGRNPSELRSVRITPNCNKYAEGSCLIEMGDTKVICTASADFRIPSWMAESGKGWVTSEYGMLPRATGTRNDREAAKGKQSGRTQEIQRLIGRSLRAAVDLSKLGPMTLKIDCDVIQADGGTRCASITGAYVALALAVAKLQKEGRFEENPLFAQVAALSVGIYNGTPVCDLDYIEDSHCGTDMNVVMTNQGGFVELQGTAEGRVFTRQELNQLLDLAENGLSQLFEYQRSAIEEGKAANE